ncbi:glycosyltransferase family 4 protein [Clostridium autoethanogenum]|uniref:glycosyltransferase family 4 protein n=1 Tax=Clostridium autoethanogenum TaxID=84023 RepID=UPI00041DB848|nr:glycosyltransferase family 1 protein [Clostridium autoethanogenum]ALU36982.1 Glycosyl transferase group 1 [Clostridium autoethanogenum DSM 10061]OVY48678.1 Mannosylfructose-phosphate synthase [Clostridium autoethanogenum]
MKIGIDAHVIGDKSGGNETYYRNLIEQITKLITDEEIYLYFNDLKKSSLINIDNENNIKIKSFKTSNAVKRYMKYLPDYVQKDKLDVLHLQYFPVIRKKCKIIGTIHDISFEHYPQYFTKKNLLMNKILIPALAKQADKILTVSNFSKQDISNKYGIDPDKIVVTYLAASEKYKVIKNYELLSQVRKKFNINGEFLLTVGNLQPRKNLSRLFTAYINLRNKKMIDEKLVVVGKKAWLFNDIFKFVNESKYKDDIIFTDYVSEEDLALLYNAAKLFVYPSVFEGFGLPPLEAMSCGTPVVTSNITSIPEVTGNAAVLFNPWNVEDMEEKIVTTINNKDMINKLSELGLKRSLDFSWKKTAQITLEAYHGMVT